MKYLSTLILILAALALPALAWSGEPSPVGFWLVQDGGAVIQIEDRGGRLAGRTVWMKDPTYPSDDPQGRAGKPRLDDANPDAAKRNRKRLGLEILSGFRPDEEKGTYSGGQVYNPREGKTYSGTLTMLGNDKLALRGYVVVTLIGKTQTWTRADPAKYGLK